MSKLDKRPTSGKLVVPFMVDDRIQPIDFKAVHPGHVLKCSRDRLCGVCGGKIANNAPIAFVGPDDGRTCFADPWMHPECARLAMEQCPFLAAKRDWREPETGLHGEVLKPYSYNMALFVAPNGRSYRDELGHFHFECLGVMRRHPEDDNTRGTH